MKGTVAGMQGKMNRMNRKRTSMFAAGLLGGVLLFGSTGLAATGQKIGPDGDGAGASLAAPGRMLADSAGNLILAGTLSNNVFRVDPAGAVTVLIDGDGDLGGNLLDQPVGLALASDGTLYVAGRVSANVFSVSAGGTITEVVDLSLDSGSVVKAASLRDLAIDSNGIVYVAGGQTDNVVRFDPADCAVDATTCATEVMDSSGDGAGNALEAPAALAIDASDNLFVAGADSDTVLRRTAAGAIDLIVGSDGDPGDTTDVLEEPRNIAVDAGGLLYVTGFASDNAYRIDPAGAIAGTPGAIEQIITAAGDDLGPKFGHTMSGPQGITTNSAGDVFIAAELTNNVFGVLAGNFVYEAVGPDVNDATVDGLPVTFESPGQVTVDSDGNLFIAAAGSNNVISFSSRPLVPKQMSCVLRLNNLYKKLVVNYLKHYTRCMVQVDSGQLVEDCFADTAFFGKDKIAKLIQKGADAAPKQCPIPPHFGPRGVAALADAAGSNQLGVLRDFFGSDFDAVSLRGDVDGFACQFDVTRQYRQCQLRQVNEFLKCMKSGLKGKKKPNKVPDPTRSPFEGSADFELCIGFDPKGKIDSTCSSLALARLNSSCANTPTGTAFPGVCSVNSSHEDFSTCGQAVSNCRACKGFNLADALSADCDLLDDGQANLSCQ